MDILIIGYEYDIDLAYQSVKTEHQVTINILGDPATNAGIFDCHTLSKYDCIVIAIKDPYFAQNIYALLRSILQNADRLIDFYEIYRVTLPPAKVDRVMANPLHNSFNGMILGISHAEVGILPELLNGNFCNLAVSSQDIYYNMKTLQYCMENYKNKIQDLQYLIFEMFDYTYFNYDVSLTKAARSYYCARGGFRKDPHNFHRNSSFPMTHGDLLLAMFAKLHPDLTPAKLELLDLIFENIHAQDQYRGFSGYSYEHVQIHLRTKMVTAEEISAYNADSSLVQNIFSDTIDENIQHFHDLLQSAYSLNPAIKIYCILMPRYHKAYEKVQSAYAPWKEHFYAIIDRLQQVYPFTFLDLTEDTISQKKEYYFDASHLNYYGAVRFSQYLNSLLSI